MKKIFLLLLISTVGLSSCKKFLSEYSQNKAYVKNATDLNELLLGSCYLTGSSTVYPSPYGSVTFGNNASLDFIVPYLDVLNDDAEEFYTGNPSTGPQNARVVLTNLHRWQQNPMVNTQGTLLMDYDWTRFYAQISVANAIITTAESLKGKDDQALLNKVEGEALFLRATYYFMLANIYGAPYSKATASSDLSVPLKINEAVSDKYYKRDNVATVYNQILADLNQAASLLNGVAQSNIYRANQAAVYAMLSRVNLYMENYQAASDAADKVIASGYAISDLNSYTTGKSFTAANSPESIFSMGPYTTMDVFVDEAFAGTQAFKVSSDLQSAFSPSDLRLSAFFTKSANTKQLLPAKSRTYVTDQTNLTPISSTILLRLPEVILNKAEALALNGDEAGAKSILNTLLVKRYAPANVPQVTQTGADLVNYIRDERRRELCFESQRWFDLRRYAVNSKYPYTKIITHNDYEYNSTANTGVITGYYQLNPYPQDIAAYSIPIPTEAIQFNQGALTNPTRPVRIKN